MPKGDYSKLTVLIPTLNEEENIGRMLNYLVKNYPKINVIVSDDDSKDNTLKVVNQIRAKNKRVGFLLRKNVQKGLVASMVDALNMVMTEYFLVIDCDFQHPPEKIAEFYRLLENKYDLVLGNRTQLSGDWPVYRKIVSLGAKTLCRIRLLPRVMFNYDVSTGFFAGRTSVVNSIINKNLHRFDLAGFATCFNILKCAPRDLKIAKVDYTFSVRTAGESKLGKTQVLSLIKSLIK